MLFKADSILMSDDSITELFGVTKRQLRALKMDVTEIDGRKCYQLDEVLTRSKKTVGRTMTKRVPDADGLSQETLKQKKLEQEALKLTMINDDRAAEYIRTDWAEADHVEKLKSVKSILSEIPDLVRERMPDISDAAIEVIESEISAALGQKSIETLRLN